MRKPLLLIIITAFFMVSCADISSSNSNIINRTNEELSVLGQEVELSTAVGISLGALSISIDNEGELEMTMSAEVPLLPTQLGVFSVFVEGSAKFPTKKTMTIVTPNKTWVYDLNGQEFSVQLDDVDAIITMKDGNIVVTVSDARVKGNNDPKLTTTNTIAGQVSMNSKQITVDSRQIGTSANNTPIQVTQIGNGSQKIVFVGGLHAGFAPGSVDLAEQAINYFSENGQEIPQNITMYIISNANPDSLSGTMGDKSGRLNGNGVDINRNWDCNWSSTAQWRNISVNPGINVFSEPETQALRDFFSTIQPKAVIFWGAKGNLVIPGDQSCGNQLSRSQSQNLASLYGVASNYNYGFINYYPISGDVTDWLDKQGIPAITVLLSDYNATDWQRNLNGIRNVLQDLAR